VAEKTALLLDVELTAEALSIGLPPIEAMLAAGVAHPYNLYIQMCSFAGSASAAGRAVVPPVFRAYDHQELHATFAQVATFIGGVLDEIHEDYRAVAFVPNGRVFELALEPAWLASHTLILGAIGQSGGSEADTAAWLDGSLIASENRMASLRERRVRGPIRTAITAPDMLGIAPRRGEVLFSVTVDAQYIESRQKLQIMHQLEGAPGIPREIVLYVANRD
jgi:type VI secretion system protein ImpJ